MKDFADEQLETAEQFMPNINPPVRDLKRTTVLAKRADENLTSLAEEANNLMRLRQEEADRRREQERIRLEREFSQD